MAHRAILWDLDGTLTDSKEGILRCTQYALKACGIEEPEEQNLIRFIGPPLVDSFSEFYQMTEPMLSFAVKKYRERYETIGWKENKVYSGIPECLQTLKAHGFQIATATSKPEPFAKKILDYFQLAPFFDAIVGCPMEHSTESKASLMQRAMQALQIPESERQTSVWMIGDRKFDAIGAKTCGIDFIGVQYGYAPKGELESYPSVYLASTVADLQAFLIYYKSSKLKS